MVYTPIEHTHLTELQELTARIHIILALPESPYSTTLINQIHEIFPDMTLEEIFKDTTSTVFASTLAKVIRHRDTAVHCLSFDFNIPMLMGLTLVMIHPSLSSEVADRFQRIPRVAENIRRYAQKLKCLTRQVDSAIMYLIQSHGTPVMIDFMRIVEDLVVPQTGLFKFHMYYIPLLRRSWTVLQLLLIWTNPSSFGHSNLDILLRDILAAKYTSGHSTNSETDSAEHARLVDVLSRVVFRTHDPKKPGPKSVGRYPAYFIPLSHSDIALAESVYEETSADTCSLYKEYLQGGTITPAANAFLLSKDTSQ